MFEGVRPKECQMCWSIEDMGQDFISDRILRGTESWTRNHFDRVKSLAHDTMIFPSYLEVSFSSVCNFKCSYCSPHVSTKWLEEIKKFGPYELTYNYQDLNALKQAGIMPFEEEDTPYTEAFWKWWPALYQNLQVFRVTGGEPLLSKHFEKILNWIETFPNPKLNLDINSNFGVSDQIIDRFIERAKLLLEKNHVARITLHTSLDSAGFQAEYIRHGLNFEKFQSNIKNYLVNVPNGFLAFMSTFNALSLPGYISFLKWILELRTNFSNHISLDIPHLVGPEHMSVRVLTEPFKKYLAEILSFMEENSREKSPYGFRNLEIGKIKRISEWMNQPQSSSDLNRWRKDFFLFFREHDRRRNTDFAKCFPEYGEFWEICKNLA